MHDVLDRPALELAALLRRGEVSSRELVTGYLERIQTHGGELSAFVDVLARRALLCARMKDAQRGRKRDLPPFHGVPIGIKDMNLVRGTRTRFGSRATPPFWSPVDDATTAQLRRAGFVILGKMATSELGAVPVTEPDVHPPTRNPWDLAHTPGGSSGGSGSAVAAGLLPVAQGSDGGGSIRIPASYCDLVGLKPSRGRLKNQFGLKDRQILYTSGALTRTVDDCAALLDVQAGITVGTPHWETPPERPFAELCRRPLRPLRIRLTLSGPLVATDPEVREAVLRTARALEALGHHVEEMEPPTGQVSEFVPIWARQIAGFPFMRWPLAQPVTRWLAAIGKKTNGRAVHEQHKAFEARLLAWFEGVDAWITPTVAILPPRVGAYAHLEDPEESFNAVAKIGAFTALANITGQPAISVPAGLSRAGLPIGAQIVAPRGGEATLLALARLLEEAVPWRDRRPPFGPYARARAAA